MSTKKEMKPIDELYDFATTDLAEIHDRLWYEYFMPKEPHDAKMKEFLRVQLNVVQAQIKIDYADNPSYHPVLVQRDTKWTDEDGLGPNIRVPIYVETVEPAVIGHYETRAKKTTKQQAEKKAGNATEDEDLLGEDEDLLGEAKPAKGKASAAKKPAADGKKTDKEVIFELADKHGGGKEQVDKIEKLSGLPRKKVTDTLWAWRKVQEKKGGKK